MRRPRSAAGRRLVDAQNEALRRSSERLGRQLLWSEAEAAALERAGETVDRAERIRKLFDAELHGEPNPAVVVKLSAELRQLDRQVVALIALLNPEGEGPVKSGRHQRAAHTRWSARGGA